MKDYAETFEEISEMVEREERDRENDDQQIIDMLNEICMKMYEKLAL